MSTEDLGETESSATIAAHVSSCLQAFTALAAALNNEESRFRETEIHPDDIQDEFGRFRIWSGNIGAHRIGRASLDYRLRDASHIRQRVEFLLQDLVETIQDGT